MKPIPTPTTAGNHRWRVRAVLWGLLFACGIAASFYAGTYKYYELPPVQMPIEDVRTTARTEDIRQNIASRLNLIAEEVRRMQRKDAAKIVEKLSDITSELDPISLAISGSFDERTPDACWEEYKDTRFGYPFYRTGFVEATDCPQSKMRPLEDLITVLLMVPPGLQAAVNDQLLVSLRQNFPRMPVALAAVPGTTLLSPAVPAKREEFATPGVLWNRLVQAARTPYVLVGRDLDYMDELARLKRLIYVISSSSNPDDTNAEGVAEGVAVASGAFRNRTGHWAAGCHRATLRFYSLTLAAGYRRSARDCMLCDVADGPFVARAATLRRLPLDARLPPAPLFVDWFLRLRDAGALAAVCPDAMFFTRSPVEYTNGVVPASIDRPAWRQFATKWRIHRLHLPLKYDIRFTCQEVGLSCNAREVAEKNLAMPSCCLKQVSKTMRALEEFSEANDIDYELDSGTVLGAVKLQNFLPWDVDGDINFVNNTFYIFKKYSKYFSERNLSVEDFRVREGKVPFNYFSIRSPDIVFEMWGVNTTSRKMLTYPYTLRSPTYLRMSGVWVRGPWHPGLYARNRYGPNYLQHAQHWSVLKLGESFAQYKPNLWKSCSAEPDHACLSHYPTDGSFDLYTDDGFLT